MWRANLECTASPTNFRFINLKSQFMKTALFNHNLMIFMITLRSQNRWYRYIIIGQQASYVQFDNYRTEINKNEHNSSQSGNFYNLYDVKKSKRI